MQEIIISFPKKVLSGNEKHVFAEQICKTLATGGSPIRYVGGTVYIPTLPELGTYKIVNKSLLLTPLSTYLETVHQQLTQKFAYEIVATTVENQLAELLSFLGGTKKVCDQPQTVQKSVEHDNTQLFHNETYIVNQLLPTVYPHIKRSLLADDIVQIEIVGESNNGKQTAKYNDFFLYILQKYNKNESALYSCEEQVEIVGIYLKYVLKMKLQVKGWLPSGKYRNLRKHLDPIAKEFIASSQQVIRKTKKIKKTKNILREGSDNDRLFNELLISELGYSLEVYKDIQEMLRIVDEKTVLQVAIDFLNMSEADYFLYTQDRQKRIIMHICTKIFQEYQIYNRTSYARWFIK